MSSMIHGIRVLSKEGCILKFKTYLIYSDWNSLPRTHGFPLLFLTDYTDYWKLGESTFEKDLEKQPEDIYSDLGHIQLSQRYVKKLAVTDFQNLPVKPKFLEATWHYLDPKTKEFHFQEHLPQATYELEVTDPKWIEHVPVGAVWETTACDLTGPYWYLETPEEKGKFYRLFQNMSGQWILNYGKKGARGRKDQLKYMNAYWAGQKIQEKIKKGYNLIYRNFDTDWNIEKELKAKAEKEKKQKDSHPNAAAIFDAIENKDVKKFKELLGDTDPNTLKNKWDQYALEAAADGYGATEQSYKITQILLEKGADPNQGGYGPFFPGLCYSNWNNPWQEKIIELFLTHGVDITLIGGTDGHSVLQTATVSGRKKLLQKCLDAGMDVMHRTKQGHTALHYAAENPTDTIEIIDLLIDHGADVNDNNGSWGTPLHFAASKGTKEAIEHLINKGADIEAKDSNGNRPIHLSAQYGSKDTMKALIDAGANTHSKNNEGKTPMELLFSRLIAFTSKVNQEALERLKILCKQESIAKQNGNDLCSQLLKESKNKNKLEIEKQKVLIELIELGYNPFWQDEKYFSLFHLAAKTQSLELMKACLEYKKPEVNITDEFGWTALHYAKATKNKDLSLIHI